MAFSLGKTPMGTEASDYTYRKIVLPREGPGSTGLFLMDGCPAQWRGLRRFGSAVALRRDICRRFEGKDGNEQAQIEAG